MRVCRPLAATGVGIAGDRFDKRIMDHVVLALLGKGGSYRSFDKILDIPGGYFNDRRLVASGSDAQPADD